MMTARHAHVLVFMEDWLLSQPEGSCQPVTWYRGGGDAHEAQVPLQVTQEQGHPG